MNYLKYSGLSKIRFNKKYLNLDKNKEILNFKNLNELNWPWKY